MWYAKGSLGAGGLAMAATIHDLSMLALTVLLVGHLYFTFVYKALSSMTTGYVSGRCRDRTSWWIEEMGQPQVTGDRSSKQGNSRAKRFPSYSGCSKLGYDRYVQTFSTVISLFVVLALVLGACGGEAQRRRLPRQQVLAADTPTPYRRLRRLRNRGARAEVHRPPKQFRRGEAPPLKVQT